MVLSLMQWPSSARAGAVLSAVIKPSQVGDTAGPREGKEARSHGDQRCTPHGGLSEVATFGGLGGGVQ